MRGEANLPSNITLIMTPVSRDSRDNFTVDLSRRESQLAIASRRLMILIFLYLIYYVNVQGHFYQVLAVCWSFKKKYLIHIFNT